MVQRTRMFKTVAALAAAMICFTSFLSWMEPATVAGAASVDAPGADRLARSVVALPAEVRPTAWDGIDVCLVASSTVPEERDCHFVVNTFGLIRRTAGWSAQSPAEEHGNAVVVALTRVGRDDRISSFQWASLRALTHALVERVPTLTRECPIRAFRPEWTERVGRMMSIDELIGPGTGAVSQAIEARAEEPGAGRPTQPTT